MMRINYGHINNVLYILVIMSGAPIYINLFHIAVVAPLLYTASQGNQSSLRVLPYAAGAIVLFHSYQAYNKWTTQH